MDTTPYRSIWTSLYDVEFEQRWINANGIQTRYMHAGSSDAPVLIMLHGTAGSWEGFSANIGPLSKHFNCYAIDMVGSGFTDQPDYDYEIANYASHLNDVMEALKISKATIIGCSLGSWVASRFALTHPEKTTGLVILSAAGLFANPSNMNRIKSARTKAVDNPVWENIKPIFDHLIHEEKNRIPDIIAIRQRSYSRPGMHKTIQHILCLQDNEVRQRNLISEQEWQHISAPTLIIGSLKDKDEYLETAQRIARLIPNAHYQEMPNVGHWPQFEDPEQFNALCLKFLQNTQ